MAQEGYQQIPVTVKAWKILKQRKLEKQAKASKDITWDDFLLEATKKGASQ